MTSEQLNVSQKIGETITGRLGGLGLFGVELFLMKDGRVLFSEVSPRPHDTGMVTMATQSWSQFALHARAILGLPIQGIHRHSAGASAAFKSSGQLGNPVYHGVEKVFELEGCDLRIFAKPDSSGPRRLAVTLATGHDWQEALGRAKQARSMLFVDGAR